MIAIANEDLWFPRLIDLPESIVKKYSMQDFCAVMNQSDKTDKPRVIALFCMGEYVLSLPHKIPKTYGESLIIVISPWSIPTISETDRVKKIKIPAGVAHWNTMIPKIDIDLDHRVFDRRFLSLNFRARWWRQALLQALCHENIISDFYFSYHARPMQPNTLRQQYDINTAVIGKTWFNESLDLDALFDQLPLRTHVLDSFQSDDEDGAFHRRQSAEHGSVTYWQNSFASVVCETVFGDNNDPVITEKTLKPLAYGQPLLLLACNGALALLQNLGFQTFSDVIDESYDSITSPQMRLEHVLREIKRLNSLSSREIHQIYKKLIPRLRSNQRVLRQDLFGLYESQRQQASHQIQTWISNLAS